MGEVYKARDTRLARTVAIKVLPNHISNDPKSKQRFEREARTIAGLNHPNICVLHDVGLENGIDFLVMEYLEGITLAERLAIGALPLTETLRIALQIADALDKAHRSGVIHRDLKPGNIMLGETGAKLLDFGLAKVENNPASPAAASEAPTADVSMTAGGAILGTLPYMAPEQIEGQAVDARADIFSFGAVLYEMITGQRAFQGKNQPSLMANILKSNPPPPSQVRPGTPPLLDHIIRGCLAKAPAERWHTARDLWLQLKWAGDPSVAPAPAAAAPAADRRLRILTGVLAIAALAAAIPAILYFQPSAPDLRVPDVQFEIPVTVADTAAFSISPDGRNLAYVSATDDGKNAIWIRPLNSLLARMLPGTDGTNQPDWSPDSRSIAFSADGKLKRVDVAGGPPQSLLEVTAGMTTNRSTWNRDGVILLANGVLRRINAASGESTDATELNQSLGETRHFTPWFLPDGQHFLYTAWGENPESRAVYVGKLGSQDRKRLMATQSKAIYSSGFLLFASERTLMARPFDVERLEFTGDPVALVQDIAHDPFIGSAAFGASAEDTLVYRRGDLANEGTRQLFWTDRTGKTEGPIETAIGALDIRLSPDGKRVASNMLSGGIGNPDVRILDLDRKLRTQLTTEPAFDGYPVWSPPDGLRLVFAKTRNSSLASTELYERPSNLAIPARPLLSLEQDTIIYPRDWSLDGKLIVFERFKNAQRRDIWWFPLEGERKAFPYLSETYDECQPVLSPNSRWLAYVSNESGVFQVVVQSFPDPSRGKFTVSTGGGMFPRWRRDGRELYYLDSNRRIVAVSVTTDGSFSIEKSTPLFQTGLGYPGAAPSGIPYDVTADGQRFLLSVPQTSTLSVASIPITVVLNWPSMLKR